MIALSHPRLSEPRRSNSLFDAVERAREYLVDLQKPDGHWVGELQGDTILESEYVILMAFLGLEKEEKVAKAAHYILQHQLPEGGWTNYPGGPVDVSVSVKAYFALKLAGHSASAPYMREACACIRNLGGAVACNSFTKFYLALLGQFPYANCAAVPPEMILLPRWAYFNIYEMSSWTRTIVVPLSICYGSKPVRRVPEDQGIAELFLEAPDKAQWPHPPTRRWLTWTNFFLAVDQAYKQLERLPLVFPWVREAAIKRAESWMLEHFNESDGLGAIFPPIIYAIISLRCLGYGNQSPEMQWAIKQLDDLMLEEETTLRLQPCFSPVWDTALTLNALSDTSTSGKHPAIQAGVDWLLDHEVRCTGDWRFSNPHLEPGGWFFEYRNAFYPDTDDTAMVLMALSKTGDADRGRGEKAAIRGVRWLLGMQNRDGGWAAFDRNINRQVLTRVPFADHNAMLDPSCPDITARVLEALGHYGFTVGQPQVDRALVFLERTQERAGCWIGRWGVNYIYGTWQVLLGLRNIGFDMKLPLVRKAVDWLKQVQQPNGSWGESCRSYDDPRLAGQGTPTASQTAWALLGLIAAGEAHSEAVRCGIEYLIETQEANGGWHENQFTGTGFPKVFYLKYHLYSLYFPLMALARFAKETQNNKNGNGSTVNYTW
jgi:squalene-hopene/tetraprenyl-beta-curcumene cyclase